MFVPTVMCNLSVVHPNEPTKIQGTQGEVIVQGPPGRPTALIVRTREPGAGEFGREIVYDFPIPGVGLGYEADGVGKSLRGMHVIERIFYAYVCLTFLRR